jgi:hypothetical protein
LYGKLSLLTEKELADLMHADSLRASLEAERERLQALLRSYLENRGELVSIFSASI